MEKLFVVVREELPLAYQGVQSGHAVAQWLLDNKDNQNWNNQTLIYLKTPKLEHLMFKLDLQLIKYTKFIEPDLDNQITAIALQTDKKYFSKLKLVGT